MRGAALAALVAGALLAGCGRGEGDPAPTGDGAVAVAFLIQSQASPEASSQVRRGVAGALDALREGTDWATVFALGDATRRLAPWSRRFQAARAMLEPPARGAPSRSPDLGGALGRVAHDLVENDDALPARRALVIVSDGRDRPDAPAEALERGLGELADVARSTDIDVVVVALARAASREAARLEALARRTRGRLMLVTDLGDDALAAAIVAASHRPNGP